MSIWIKEIQIEQLNARGKDTMPGYLGIEFVEIKNDALIARMQVHARTHQPAGILHGGATCVLAETVGSTAANFCISEEEWCVGLEINVNHLRRVSSGFIYATAKPFHLGKSTHVWGIEVHNDQQSLMAVSRLTMAVLKRKT